MSLFLIDDFRDRRARPARAEAEPLASWVTALTASCAAFVTDTSALLDHLLPTPCSAHLTRTLVATAFLAISIYTLRARTLFWDAAAREDVRVYKFGPRARLVSKVGVPLFLALSVWRLEPLVPVPYPHSPVAGYVCRRDGAALSSGTVELCSICGAVVSTRPEDLDTDGFFEADLRRWAPGAVSIRLQSSDCGGEPSVDLADDQDPAYCHDSRREDHPGRALDAWTIQCEPRVK